MLTRLKVNGFKNLVDVDVRFGPFTCIAGANGVGKSNLFDAIRFLSALADKPLIEAAQSIRGEDDRSADVRNLFHRVGTSYDDTITFEAEMIIPRAGVNELNQRVEAAINFLRYSLTLAYRSDTGRGAVSAIEVVSESLEPINVSESKKYLLFPHSHEWRETAIRGRRSSPFISTTTENGETVVILHQERRGPRRTAPLLAASLPRTVLSTPLAAENPTVFLARREMQSWQLLQLEPSALRKSDALTAPKHLKSDGSYLAATLYNLAQSARNEVGIADEQAKSQVYEQITGRLAQLIGDVHEVSIDVDEKRNLLTLQVTGFDRTTHPARALSDGTLRFLALAVLAQDAETQGVLCLEEPENGIHPERIPAILRLLQDIALSANDPVGLDNPLRQIIVNTHSPGVVGELNPNDLLIADTEETKHDDRFFKRVVFSCLSDTWRTRDSQTPVVARGKLVPYLNPFEPRPMPLQSNGYLNEKTGDHKNGYQRRRVIDRPDLQLLIPFADETE